MISVSEIRRKKGESFETFIRRVKVIWKRSGKILQAKKVQYYIPHKSKNVVRQQTINRLKNATRLEYLRKIGKLPAEEIKMKKK